MGKKFCCECKKEIMKGESMYLTTIIPYKTDKERNIQCELKREYEWAFICELCHKYL